MKWTYKNISEELKIFIKMLLTYLRIGVILITSKKRNGTGTGTVLILLQIK